MSLVMGSRSDEENDAAAARLESPEFEDSSLDPARVYFNRIARNRLLGRAAEVALAKRIEDSEHLMLAALLDVPALHQELLRARAEVHAAADGEPTKAVKGKRGSTEESSEEMGRLLDQTIALLSRVTAARRRSR